MMRYVHAKERNNSRSKLSHICTSGYLTSKLSFVDCFDNGLELEMMGFRIEALPTRQNE
jgi:hypothetical protein